MQNAAAFRTVTRNAVYLVALAAVAAAGVGVGRWVIPEGSTGASTVRYISGIAPAAGQDAVERKLAQMDAEDARHGAVVAGFARAPSAPGAGSIMERKLAQMDKLDSRAGPEARRTGGIIERKFAQMDAEDTR